MPDDPDNTTAYRPKIRGRGALENPTSRFERLAFSLEPDPDDLDGEAKQLKTQVFRDSSRTIISTNDSPDIGMEATINPYRGCEHGCIYCYARPTHEYLGLSAGLDFETKIFAKPDAPKLLEEKLKSPSWQPKVVTLSGVTDCYQPIERSLKITRGCLEVLADFRNPVAIITKNHMVMRDIDLFQELASYDAASVNLSITTLENSLSRRMEPRASVPAMRLKAIEALAKAGVPVGIMIGPVLPGLTEHEIPAILESVASAGAQSAHYTMLRLPYGVKDIFQTWLQEHYPDRADKVLNRVRSMRDGNLNDPEFGTRMTGKGFYADQISQIFDLYKKRYHLNRRHSLSTASFRRNARDQQLSLF
ncbi:MAG: PA0069 family radical SAM protein [Micavibrio sp.]